MRVDIFEQQVEALHKTCMVTLGAKSDEYGNDTDGFANFKEPCVLLHKTPFEVWLGYWAKGMISLYDNVANKVYDESFADKLISSIGYLYLLSSMVKYDVEKEEISKSTILEDAEKTFKKCKDILVQKREVYAKNDEDRLGMFKRAATVSLMAPEEVLVSYMVKHTNSIIRMIQNGTFKDSPELFSEKVGDQINYLYLLDALVSDTGEEINEELVLKAKKRTAKKKQEEKTVEVPADTDPLPFEVPSESEKIEETEEEDFI